MKKICFAVCIALAISVRNSFGSEAGMPQLDTEFWVAQIFWLLLTFTILYLIIWKIFLPKITYGIENRKSRVVNNLNEVQKLKENAEKKLEEYNKIIEDTKRTAAKIIEDNKKKLDKDLEQKKQQFTKEIEKELADAENEIKNLRKNSVSNVSKIASDISSEIIKTIIDAEVNKSNVSAISEDVTKKKFIKYI